MIKTILTTQAMLATLVFTPLAGIGVTKALDAAFQEPVAQAVQQVDRSPAPKTVEQRCAEHRRTFEELKAAFDRDEDALEPRVRAIKKMSDRDAKMVNLEVALMNLRAQSLVKLVVANPSCYSAATIEHHRSMLTQLQAIRS